MRGAIYRFRHGWCLSFLLQRWLVHASAVYFAPFLVETSCLVLYNWGHVPRIFRAALFYVHDDASCSDPSIALRTGRALDA